MSCNFSLPHYFATLAKAMKSGYKIVPINERDSVKDKKHILLRHDIDYSIDYAYKLASEETKRKIKSSYFILMRSDFYNPLSSKNIEKIRFLAKHHEIGLHYEAEMLPPNPNKALEILLSEIQLLEKIIGKKINTVSAHNVTTGLEPTKKLINILSKYVTDTKNLDIKYISDSTQNWREGCMCRHVGKHEKLQILTHPFLWHDNHKTYEMIFENFRDELIKEIQKRCNERINYRKLYLKRI